MVRRAFETGEPAGYDTHVVTESGQGRWYHTDVGPVKEGDGVVAVVIATTDITGRKEAEEALRRSEERYRIVTGLSSDYAYAYRVEPDGTLISEWVTGTLTRMTGFSPEEVGSRASWTNLVHPDDVAVSEEQLRIVLSGRAATVEYRISAKGGRVLWVRDYAEPLVDETTRRVTRIFGAVKDITEQRRTLEALRESEEKYRNVVERARDGIAVVSGQLVRYVNPGLARMMGYPLEEVVGTPFVQYLDEGEREWIVDRYRRRLAGEDVPPVYQTVLRDRDGRRVEVELNAGVVPYEGEMADLVFVRDISERRRTEEELRRRNQDLALLKGLSDAANRGDSVPQMLALLSKYVATLFRCRGVSLYLMDNDGKALVLQNVSVLPEGLLERVEEATGQTLPVRVAVRLREGGPYHRFLGHGRPQLVTSPEVIRSMIAEFARGQISMRLVPIVHRLLGITSVIVVPLNYAGDSFGLLEVSRAGNFDESSLLRFEVIARHFSAILARRREDVDRNAAEAGPSWREA